MFEHTLLAAYLADTHNREAFARMEHDRYDVDMMRGPMIEADLDDRLPTPWREMIDGDL